VVVLDLVMPVMGGEEVFRALREEYPRLKVLLSSGHDMQETTDDLMSTGAAGFLRKPYDLDELENALAEALGS